MAKVLRGANLVVYPSEDGQSFKGAQLVAAIGTTDDPKMGKDPLRQEVELSDDEAALLKKLFDRSVALVKTQEQIQ